MTAAIYPGTFDPVTFGHLDLIERTAKICSRLIVAVGLNPEKRPLFSPDERVHMIQEVSSKFPNVEVTKYSGLLVDFARKSGVFTVVRSLRTTTEYELEIAMSVANRQMEPRLEVVFLMPSLEYAYLNSTLVREIARFGGDVTAFVPPSVEKRLKAKFA
ncbi:MAG: pantetheine-phosphate adenylyltransferase [Gemmatimonadota bacterium]|nr:pantetheine-phosphate adenylyltransferase [Gemmatimonadota bacterium]